MKNYKDINFSCNTQDERFGLAENLNSEEREEFQSIQFSEVGLQLKWIVCWRIITCFFVYSFKFESISYNNWYIDDMNMKDLHFWLNDASVRRVLKKGNWYFVP